VECRCVAVASRATEGYTLGDVEDAVGIDHVHAGECWRG
jgi:hypothetical protein